MKLKKKERAELLFELFKKLDEENWPLVFLHFQYEMYQAHSFWDNEKWVEIAGKTLANMLTCPSIEVPEDMIERTLVKLAMQELFRAAKRYQTLEQILEKFIQTRPCKYFIPTMDQFFRNNYYGSLENGKEFKELLAKALINACEDPTEFIAECLVAQMKKDRILGNSYGTVNLQKQLWDEPFITSDEKRGSLTYSFIRKVGASYIWEFKSIGENLINDFRCLKIKDAEFTESIFSDFLNILCMLKISEEEKAEMLKNISSCYLSIGYNVFQLFQKEKLKKVIAEVQRWYQIEDLLQPNRYKYFLDYSLLNFFNGEKFNSIVFENLKAAVSQGLRSYEMDNLFAAMKELGCLKAMLDLLYEEQEELCSLIKEKAEKNLAYSMSYYSPIEITLMICKLVPDWKEHLSSWVNREIRDELASFDKGLKEEMKKGWSSEEKAKKHLLSRGFYFQFREVVELYLTLDKAGLFEELLESLPEEEFQDQLEGIYQKFEKEKVKRVES